MKDYFLTIIQPRRALETLLQKPNYFRLGFIYIAVPILAYTLMYVLLAEAGGAPSTFTPWLNIPKVNYYDWNRYLLAPSMILCWIAATATAQILSVFASGKGRFEQTLSALALSISVAMWGGLIHDLPMSFLSWIGVIDPKEHEIAMNSATIFRTLLWVCYSIYFVAFAVLFSFSIRVVHRLNWKNSISIGLGSFIIFQVVFLIFNR